MRLSLTIVWFTLVLSSSGPGYLLVSSVKLNLKIHLKSTKNLDLKLVAVFAMPTPPYFS